MTASLEKLLTNEKPESVKRAQAKAESTLRDIDRAEARMASERSHAYATAARYSRGDNRVIISLHTGLELALSPHLVENLADATADDLSEIEISPSGFGLHWPQLDADLYVPALLKGKFDTKE